MAAALAERGRSRARATWCRSPTPTSPRRSIRSPSGRCIAHLVKLGRRRPGPARTATTGDAGLVAAEPWYMDRLVVDLEAIRRAAHHPRDARAASAAGGGSSWPSPTNAATCSTTPTARSSRRDNEFCRQALFSKEGFRRCNDSVKVVRDRLRGGRSKRKRASSTSATSASTWWPRRSSFDGELVGFLFTGGRCTRSRRQADKQRSPAQGARARPRRSRRRQGARGRAAGGPAHDARSSSSTCAT